MNEDRGAALRLLYQLKLALDKHFTTDHKGVTNLKRSFVDKKYQKSMEFQQTLKKAPMQTLKAQHNIDGPSIKNKKLAIVENKLLKFEAARADLEKKAFVDNGAEMTLLASI